MIGRSRNRCSIRVLAEPCSANRSRPCNIFLGRCLDSVYF
nr:MAG TPA: hypothetical protein [Caudoviricetes sp.]